MDTLYYEAKSGGKSKSLFVLLPGRNSAPDAFEKEGFIQAVREKDVAVDVVAVNAHIGYYMERSITVRLKEDIIKPAKSKGYKQIWLVGISMGGLGALLYEKQFAHDISGIIIVAPYLGEEKIVDEVRKAGGIWKWAPDYIAEGDWQSKLWLWLKHYEQHKNNFPPIYLGYGEDDRFVFADTMLASILPPERVIVIKGSHDWQTWRRLWDVLLVRTKPIINDRSNSDE